MSATGQIFIEALDLYAYHGHFAEEGRLGQRFSMDLVLDCDLRASSVSDDLADTVDYGEVVALDGEAERQAQARNFGERETAEFGATEAEIGEAEKRVAVGVELGREPCRGANG